MNENKRLITIGIVILAIVGLILAITFWPKADKSFICGVKADKGYAKIGSVDYNQYKCMKEIEGKQAIVYTKDLTKEKKKTMNTVAKQIGHSIYYLNLDRISNKDLKSIKKDLGYDKKDAVIIVNKGKATDKKESILTNAEELKNFLKDAKLAKFACDVKTNEEYENLGQLTYDDYNCLYESGETFALMFSQTTCSYCMQFKPVINDYVGKENIPLYIIEVNTLDENERRALLSSLEYFDENNSWGTPLTLAIKNKKVVADMSGYTDKEEEIEEFFKKAGLK